MTKILLSGCGGKMGRVIASCVADREDCEIVAGIDPAGMEDAAFPVFGTAAQFDGQADVIIDFSHPSALEGILSYAVSHHTPAVIATTGLNEQQIAAIHEAAHATPIFFSANMSIGVSLLTELAQKAARVLGGSFDIEIIEKHHNQKIDAPSGTALMLADAISGELRPKPHYEFDRHSKRAKRDKNEIGIHAVRGGTIVGEHEVLFAGRDELVSISHSARSKEIFAVGAVNAAVFLCGRPAGLYAMRDLVNAK